MRQIGSLADEKLAQRFEDYLLARGVRSRVDQHGEDFEIWIIEEDQVDQAREELARFQAEPDADHYREAASAASAVRKQKEKEIQKATRRFVDMRQRWEQPFARRCPVTFMLIVISLFVTMTQYSSFEDPSMSGWLRSMGNENALASKLAFTAWADYSQLPRADGIAALRITLESGQIWRLITPIFMHNSFMHILFNMMWLYTLGAMIEFRRGSLKTLGMIVLIAVGSNLAQCVFSGPLFGGMSGVDYGLFGYVWMRSRYAPEDGLHLPPNTVFLMMIFFVLCFTGVFGPIGNWAHSVGLLSGMAFGYLPIKYARQ